MKRKKNEYFIGMVYSANSNRKYSKRRRKRQRQLILRRGIIIALCCILLMGLGAVTYFCIVPSVSKIFISGSSSVSSADEATSDEVTQIITTPSQAVTEIPTEAPTTEPTTVAPTEAPTTIPTTVAPTEPAPVMPEEFTAPVIKDDGTDGTLYSSTLYLWKNKGFNLFGSTDKVAKNYATALNGIVKKLDKKITVYNMVVPNHTEFGLPQRIKSDIGCTSQADNIKTISKNLSDRIQSINCYNALANHNDEYIYYNTDHHWTSLGAYYAYTAFCEQTGKTPMDISKLKKNSIDGFTGSFYTLSGSGSLYNNSDTVIYYTLPNKTSAQMKERMGSQTIHCDVYYPASTSGTLTYGVFCWGDTAQFKITSNAGTGKKIAVVKDSYGNAFAPYLTAHYDEIHLIDYRYYSGDLNSYLEQNGIDEVLFLNNTMSANSASQVAGMKNALS